MFQQCQKESLIEKNYQHSVQRKKRKENITKRNFRTLISLTLYHNRIIRIIDCADNSLAFLEGINHLESNRIFIFVTMKRVERIY